MLVMSWDPMLPPPSQPQEGGSKVFFKGLGFRV